MAFLGEIRMVPFGTVPPGWMSCDGQLLDLASPNFALFSILGTTYGGNGFRNFALPDLRGRVPIHASQDFFLGERGGEAAHTLTLAELPPHTHSLRMKPLPGSTSNPNQALLAISPATLGDVYASSGQTRAMDSGAVSSVGGNAPHTNMQPFMTFMFIICTDGFFPSEF